MKRVRGHKIKYIVAFPLECFKHLLKIVAFEVEGQLIIIFFKTDVEFYETFVTGLSFKRALEIIFHFPLILLQLSAVLQPQTLYSNSSVVYNIL